MTVYEHPDGLLTSREFDEIEPGTQRLEDIEVVQEVLGSVGGMAGDSSKVVVEEMVRGVRKSVIDSLRGERAHATMAHEWNADTVKADYAKVGITITDDEASEIYSSISDFTSAYYSIMREAFKKNAEGKALDFYEKEALRRFNLIGEYTKIAPVYKNEAGALYRGVMNHGEAYTKGLLNLAVGDIFDLEMPSSFSSEVGIAAVHAGDRGVILSIENASWHEAISMTGFSQFLVEKEVLVGDRAWKVLKVFDDVTGCRNIVLTRMSGGGG